MCLNASDENIWAELIHGDQSDEEDVIGCSQNKTEISPENVISLINAIQDFVATLPNFSDIGDKLNLKFRTSELVIWAETCVHADVICIKK